MWWLNEGGIAGGACGASAWLDSVPYELAYGVGGLRSSSSPSASIGLLALALVGVPVIALWFGQVQAMALTRHHVQRADRANTALRGMMQSTVESLARTIEARDPYTGGHTERVGQFAHAIAAQLGLEGRRPARHRRRRGHPRHRQDRHPRRRAAQARRAQRRGVGDDAPPPRSSGRTSSTSSTCPQLAKDDGPPPPRALRRHAATPTACAGEDIPLAARILTVADALDAMTSDRPYRKALSMRGRAAPSCATKAGTQFCPRVVAAALDVI